MRSRILCILLGMAMGWTSTGTAAVAGSYPSVETAKPLQPPYTERRWIGLRQEGLTACPNHVDGWHVESLLDQALKRADEGRHIQQVPVSLSQQDLDLYRKYDLDRLCAYTQDDPSKPFPNPLPPGLLKAERDRMALTANSVPPLGTLGDQTWPTLADHFLSQVGRVQLVRTARPSVRLVFVDTSPTSEQLPDKTPLPNSWHGYTMAHYAQQLICSDAYEPQSCAVHIATRLALRYESFDPNMSFSSDSAPPGGGQMGLISELAVAILAEIEQWQKTEPKAKLILNLSVGWDGELHGMNGLSDLDARKVSDLEPSVQMVYNALRYAAHRGVLVIAAAGNRRGGPQKSQWPVLPAAWELRRPSRFSFPLRKTVYAVGGIDWQGLPLPNARSGGKPWRAVYGDHAVVSTGIDSLTGDPESTQIYTGTSVSTAVASSIAAVVWRLQPHLGPAQVMRLIGHSGETLASRADFYAWNWRPLSSLIKPPRLRRLSLCGAVLRICGPDERRCPSLKAIHCELCEHPAADLSLLQPTPSTHIAFNNVGSPPPPCNPMAQTYRKLGDTTPAADLCPMESYPDMSNPDVVNTQPPENPCPSCNIVPDPPRQHSSYAINVELGQKWFEAHPSDHITKASLIITCKTGLPSQTILDISDQFPSHTADVRKLHLATIGSRPSLEGCTASVDFVVQVSGTTVPRSDQSPVYVDP